MKRWEPGDRVTLGSDPLRGRGTVAYVSGWALVTVDWDGGARSTHHADELKPFTPQSRPS